MKIICASIYALDIPFQQSFSHHYRTRHSSDSIIVSLTAENGVTGFGEAAPRPYVTGEQVKTCIDHIKAVQFPIISQCPFPLLRMASDPVAHLAKISTLLSCTWRKKPIIFNASKAAVEAALADLYLKLHDLSFGEILPPAVESVNYSAVISDGSVEKMCRLAEKIHNHGFKHVKVKVGSGSEYQKLSALREILGPDLSLRIDCNCAYNLTKALDLISSISSLQIRSIEQPIPPGNVDELAELRRRSSIPLMVDESLVTENDAKTLFSKKACDLINVRISKNGGFFPVLGLIERARQAGIGYQIGCQVGETAILSALGRHLAAHLGDALFVEGSFGTHLLSEDISQQEVQFGWGGKASLLSGPGLGIMIKTDLLLKYAKKIFSSTF